MCLACVGSVDFSGFHHQGRWCDTTESYFKVLKKDYCQPRILSLLKIFFSEDKDRLGKH